MADNSLTSVGDTIRDVQKGGSGGPKSQVTIIDIGGAGAESLLAAGQKTMSASVPMVLASDHTPVPVVPSGNVASGATDSGNPIKVGAVYHASAITLTDGQRGDLQADINGYLKVNVVAGGGGGSGSNAAAGATGSAVPASGDFSALNVGGTLRGQTGTNPSGTIYAAQTDVSSIGGATFALGQQLAAGSIPVVLTAAQIATLTPPTAITGFATSTAQTTTNTSLASIATNTGLTALESGGHLASVDGKTPPLGQALAAASVPVVLTAAQAAALTPPAAITNFANETGGNLASIATNVATAANQTALATLTGPVTETAPATDTASSGLNGRLQRLAQRLTSLLALFPTSLGQKAMAGSLSTTIASDQAAIPTTATLAAGSALVGKFGIDQTTPGTTNAVSIPAGSAVNAATTGGWTPTAVNSAATTNATTVKASPGQVGTVTLGNSGAGWAYLKLYDATSVIAGSGTPVGIIPLPPGSGNNPPLAAGLKFSTGISYTITGGPAATDTTAVALGQVTGTIGYL